MVRDDNGAPPCDFHLAIGFGPRTGEFQLTGRFVRNGRTLPPEGYVLLLADGEETVELDATGAAVPRRGSGGVDLPVLTGLSGRDLETEEGRLLVGKAIEVLGLLGEFGFPPDRHLSEIHVDGREVDLVWMETGTLIRTGSGGYREKIMKLRAVYGALDEDGRFPSLVDLRFDRQVVVR